MYSPFVVVTNDAVYKRCSKCGVIKPLNAFYNFARGACGKSSHCKDCQRERYLRLKDYYSDIARRNRLKHKARYAWNAITRLDRQRGLSYCSYEEWIALLESFGNKCLCCGATDNITIDHIIPREKGGLSTIDNLQPLCLSCNSRKRANEDDFRNGQPEVIEFLPVSGQISLEL